jgi:hypothetical protein
MMLYKIDVCMKLFKLAADRGGTSEPGNSKLSNKKRIVTTKTLEIYLVYPWEPPQCT